ncbi:MAG TPA: O-antigen ligase family protein [Bacteroidota bacterium]|nr:O-antigen ligase family protein [Bacteroidota bacterium]
MRFQGRVALFVLAISVAAVGAILATEGNLFAGFALVGAVGLALVSVYRLEWSLWALLAFVLCFDQFSIPGFEPITYKIGYFLNLKEHPYLPRFNVGVVNLIELHLVLLLLIWVIVLSAQRPVTVARVPGWGAFILCFAGLAFAFINGLSKGGDLLVALWEVRALAYFGLLYWFVSQVIQTKEHVKTIVGLFIIFISFKALQGVARFAYLGFSFHGLPTITNHEDPVFITTLVVLLLGMVLFDARVPQRTALLWLFLPLLLGFFTGQRRAAYGALVVSMVAFVLLLQSKERWVFLKVALPVLTVLALYCAAFWESESKWASPVRLVKTALSADQEVAGDRYYSNLYREFENYNLASTVRRAPMLGIGFGNKYDMPLPLASIPFPLRDYIPHNQILWLLVKGGAIGYFCFWFFFNCLVFRGAFAFVRLRDPYFKAICAVLVVAVFNQMVVSYYDLQLTYYRNMIYLGTLAGLLPTLEHLDSENLDRAEQRGIRQ